MHRIAYYITAHGYGHGVRSCDILRAFRRLHPGVEIHVVTDLPADFLRHRIGEQPGAAPLHFRRGSFDSGMFQLDSVRVDLARSLADAQSVQVRRVAAREEEVSFLRRERIGAVVADIPAIPLEAAKAAGITALAVGNFGWDWIYEDFVPREPRWQPIVDAFREGYARTDLLIRLPFSEPMSAFPRRRDIPLVSAPGCDRRSEVAGLSGADPAKPWVLLSFTTLEWDAAALERVQAIEGFEFFTVKPLGWPGLRNVHAIDRHAISFVDMVASCDLVVSKPGYGILSECAVADKPLVYVEREDFREYPVLAAAIKRHLRHVHLPAAKLYAGDLEAALHEGRKAPAPIERMATGGEIQAAELIWAAL